MSTYLVRFIEVKNKETGKWELLKQITDHYKVKRYIDGEWVDSKAEHEVAGKEVDIVLPYAYDNACSFRQYFSKGWCEFTDQDYGLSERGLPDDVSDELKAYIEDEKERWGVTWFTYKELDDMLEAEKKDFFNNLVAKIKDTGEDSIIERLDHIITNMKKPLEDRKKFKGKKKDEEDSIEYYIDEMIWGWRSIDMEQTKIDYVLKDLHHHFNTSDVRIIIYFC